MKEEHVNVETGLDLRKEAPEGVKYGAAYKKEVGRYHDDQYGVRLEIRFQVQGHFEDHTQDQSEEGHNEPGLQLGGPVQLADMPDGFPVYDEFFLGV